MDVLKQSVLVIARGLVSIPLGLIMIIVYPITLAHEWLDDKIVR